MVIRDAALRPGTARQGGLVVRGGSRYWRGWLLLVLSSVAGCAHPMFQPDPALGPQEYEEVYYDEVPEGSYGSAGVNVPDGYELVDPSNPPIGGEYVMGDVEWSDEYADCEYEESDAEREARHALAKKRCDYAMYRAEDRVTSGTVKCLRKGRDAVDTTIDDAGNCAQKHIHRIPIYLHRIPGKLRKVPVRPKKVALSCHPTPFYRGPVGYSGSYVRHLEMRDHLNAERELLYGSYDGDPSGVYRAANGRERNSPRLAAAIAEQKKAELRTAELEAARAAQEKAAAGKSAAAAVLEPASVIPQRQPATPPAAPPRNSDDIPVLR